jgi:Transposase DDE domain group 1
VAAECHIQFNFRFQPKLTVDFAGGEITSEAGLVLLREFDERLKLTASLKGLVVDERDRRYIEHPALNLLRQRIYQIAAGYEDANDATFLRHDPTLRAVAGRVKYRWLPSRLCRGWKMRSPGNRSALWSAWAWSGSSAAGRKGSAEEKSSWTSIRRLIRPTGSSS